ncbi:MAG: hypothetical protein V7754_21215 [Halioglobus sp.]
MLSLLKVKSGIGIALLWLLLPLSNATAAPGFNLVDSNFTIAVTSSPTAAFVPGSFGSLSQDRDGATIELAMNQLNYNAVSLDTSAATLTGQRNTLPEIGGGSLSGANSVDVESTDGGFKNLIWLVVSAALGFSVVARRRAPRDLMEG